MTETQQEIRILLGPVAKSLIEGIGRNRPTALDEAIVALQEKVRELSERPPSEAQGQPLSDAKALSVLETQTRAIREMSEIAITEMKMTRLLVSALLQDSDNDDPQLRELANRMVDQLYEHSIILTTDDRDNLLQKEEAFLTATRQELERAPEPEKADEDREMER